MYWIHVMYQTVVEHKLHVFTSHNTASGQQIEKGVFFLEIKENGNDFSHLSYAATWCPTRD